MLSGRMRYTVTDGADYLRLMVEAGSSLRATQFVSLSPRGLDIEVPLPRRNATRFLLEAGKAADLGPLQGMASFAFGLGAENLAVHKQFRLGAASFENRWRNDAFRSIAAALEAPLADAHLAAFSGPGPVAYLLAAAHEGSPFLAGGTPFGRNLLAGSVSLSTGPLAENEWLRPLRVAVFSGIGTAWSDGAFLAGFAADDLLADAGLGLRYDVAALPLLRRWTAQSAVLQGLQFVAKFPFWASDPERIDAGQDPLAFRWLIGLRVGE